jgi:hypothetical protein
MYYNEALYVKSEDIVEWVLIFIVTINTALFLLQLFGHDRHRRY